MELGYLVCGLPVMVFLLDLLLSSRWYPSYFRYGLPLLRQTWPLRTTATLSECLPSLERDYLHDLRPVIEFRRLGQEEYAFQEQVFAPRGGLRYLHIMHGYLGIDTNSQQLVLIGFAKWYIVVGLLLLLPILGVPFVREFSGGTFGQGLTEFLGLVPVIIGLLICYGIQVWRYHHVGKAAAGLLAQRP